jgi:glucose-6-phosphate isomerase
MNYTHDIRYCFDDKVAEHGITKAKFDALYPQAEAAAQRLLQEAESGERPLFNLKSDGTNIAEIEKLATHIRENFKHMFVLGTGGSTLTGQTVLGLKEMEHRFNAPETQVHFMENVDPNTFNHLFDGVDLTECCFLVISKSGRTLETLAQFSVCVNMVRVALSEKEVSRRFWIISDPKDSPLRRIAKKLSIPDMEHVEKIGGRFSIFTNVALLPAAVAGIDIRAFRRGAKNVIDAIRSGKSNAPLDGAVLNILMEEKGVTNTVLMPYLDRMQAFTIWFRQIWAESLGKGGKGTTPICGLGTIDQHSQQQLYLDGPHDKLFSFVSLDRRGRGHTLDVSVLDDPDLEYMHGSTMGDVITISCDSVYQTFIKYQRPVRSIVIKKLDETTLGELSMHFIVETVLVGYMHGIDPYDQPAVENAKNLAKKLLAQ